MGNLDDFFAKKDKKKVKGKKFDNLDEIGKRLEKSEKKLEKLQKIEQPSLDHEVTATSSALRELDKKEEEEWEDFQAEGESDLTDLKIKQLEIDDADDGGYGGGSDENGEGGGGSGEKHAWGPAAVEEKPPVKMIEDIPIREVEPPKEQTKSGYVPPHKRSAMVAAPLPRKGGGRRPKVAPDINSEMAFPSLSDAQNQSAPGAWGKKKPADDRGFESVKHGSTRSNEDSMAPKLSTTNRFDALTDHS